MQFCIKVVVSNRSTNTQPILKLYFPDEPENLRFAPIIMFILDFGFLIDIIDNIITHSP